MARFYGDKMESWPDYDPRTRPGTKDANTASDPIINGNCIKISMAAGSVISFAKAFSGQKQAYWLRT
ncbi:hypothetical protein OH492_22005 [Vibrio chagasii]|nr:hypothetical protein [Vibrio chagasii]